MKHLVSVGKSLDIRSPKEMEIGQVGELVSNPYKGEICIRAFNHLVSLVNPENVWLLDTDITGIKLSVFPLGTKIELTIGGLEK